MSDWVRKMVRNSPEAKPFERFLAGYMPRDQYVYCVSDQCSEVTMRKFDYDACVCIRQPQEFFLVLSQCIAYAAMPVGMFFCQYRDRVFAYDEADQVYPEIIKTAKYGYQREVRVLWNSTGQWSDEYDPDVNPAPALKPLVVSDPQLASYCTIVA